MDGGVTAGGSHTLGGLIDDHGDAIAADLSEHYQIDVRDLFRDGSGLSPRWVLLHIVQLPQSSRFYAEKRGGPQFRGWDESRYALAAAVNAVRALQYTYVAAHSKHKPKPPEPFPVPDSVVEAKKKKGGFADMVSRLQSAQLGAIDG